MSLGINEFDKIRLKRLGAGRRQAASLPRSVFGVNLGHMWHESDMIAGWMEILLKDVVDGWVRPHVDKSFPLTQAGEAQTYIEERKNIGKVVLTT